jgi:2-polyprenylphenol 6-hydroxylase
MSQQMACIRGCANNCRLAWHSNPFIKLHFVANFKAAQEHQGVARQWFLPHETMALLPLPNQMVSMVWAVSTERAQTLLNLSG